MFELLKNRRSIRKFERRPVEPEKIRILEEALLRAPSSKNLHSQEFIFVEDAEAIARLAGARPQGSSFLEGVPLAVVILGSEETIDVWIEDAALAAMIGQLTAASLGLGSCWIQIRNRDHDDAETAETFIRQILGIPENMRVLAILALGYPGEEKEPHSLESLHPDRIHTGRY